MSFYKSLVKEYLLYGVVTLSSRLLSFILLPIYTRKLSPADYGVLELLDITGFLITAFLGMRLGEAMLYFRSKAQTGEERSRAVATSFAGTLVCAGLVWMGCGLGASAISSLVFGTRDYTRAVQLALWSAAAIPAAEMGLLYLRATAKPARFTAASIARMACNGGIAVYLLVVREAGIYGVLSAAVATNICFVAYAMWEMRKDLRAGWGSGWRAGRLLEQLRYAAPLAGSGLALLVLHQGDRVFLQHYGSLANVGVYSVAYKFGMAVSLAQAPFMMFWGVKVFDLAEGEEGDRHFSQAGTYLLLLLTSVALVVSLFGRPLVTLLTPPAYQSGWVFLPWIAAAYVMRGVADHFRTTLSRHRRTELDFKITAVTVVVCLALYWLLIPRFGSWGAVAATLVSFGLMLCLAVRESRQFRRYRLESGKAGRMIALALALIALNVWLMPADVWGQVVMGVLLACAFPAGLAASGFFTLEEKQRILVYCRGLVQ